MSANRVEIENVFQGISNNSLENRKFETQNLKHSWMMQWFFFQLNLCSTDSKELVQHETQ